MRVAAKVDFGLSTADLNKIAERLPSDRSAIILLMENTWESRFKEVAARYGGTLLRQKMIPAEAIVQFGRSLAGGEVGAL